MYDWVECLNTVPLINQQRICYLFIKYSIEVGWNKHWEENYYTKSYDKVDKYSK